ncbi:MAG: acyl-CoA dehydrogenase family protein [Fimbriimonadaceae bacterium]
MASESEVLEIAERFLREEIAPNAAEIDTDPEVLRTALNGLCERHLMTLRRPIEYGGPGVSEGAFRHFQEQVARYSGTLAFLQTQHQSAGSMIAKSKNESLKLEYLPKMGNGERLLGIGFSQLRRSGPPLVRARPVKGGYMLDGHVPWVTGYSFYHEFLIGATLPDGDAVFGVVPFDNVDSEAEGELSDYVEGTSLVEISAQSLLGASITGLEASFRPDVPDALPTTCSIKLSAPMHLAAMEAALTVTADLENWFLPDRLVCFIQPADWIKNNDMINIVLQGHFALGCARGSLDVLQAAAEKKGLAFLQDAYKALDRELEECRAATQNPGDDRESPIDRLAIRAWAIDLAVRCAHAAVAASSGAANSLQHPAQRLYREALVYTVSAQTPAIMEATLKRLAR